MRSFGETLKVMPVPTKGSCEDGITEVRIGGLSFETIQTEHPGELRAMTMDKFELASNPIIKVVPLSEAVVFFIRP